MLTDVTNAILRAAGARAQGQTNAKHAQMYHSNWRMATVLGILALLASMPPRRQAHASFAPHTVMSVYRNRHVGHAWLASNLSRCTLRIKKYQYVHRYAETAADLRTSAMMATFKTAMDAHAIARSSKDTLAQVVALLKNPHALSSSQTAVLSTPPSKCN